MADFASSLDSELQSDRARDGSDVLAVEASVALANSELTHRGEIAAAIRCALFRVRRPRGARPSGERHDLHAAQFTVGRVVADDNGRLPGARRMSRSCTEGGGMRSAFPLCACSIIRVLYVLKFRRADATDTGRRVSAAGRLKKLTRHDRFSVDFRWKDAIIVKVAVMQSWQPSLTPRAQTLIV